MKKQPYAWMVVVACCGFTLTIHAQTGVPVTAPPTFPAKAQAPTAAELSTHLGGNVFKGKTAAGQGWRLDFRASGHVFADTSTGARDSGTWRSEDSKVCLDYRGRFPSGCAEVRIAPQTIYYLRNTGEIVTLLAD
jgi:hypothetical protein